MKWLAALAILIALNLFVEHQFVFTGSRIIKNTELWNEIASQKSPPLQNLIRELQNGTSFDWIAANAPVIWWSKEEQYPARDPLELFAHSQLWYREVNSFIPYWTTSETRLNEGATNFHEHHPQDVVTRLYERDGISEGHAGFELRYDKNQILQKPAPLLWRLSLFPLFKEIQTQNPQQVFIPIEFWYYSNYNYTGIYFGDHYGDWESFLVLLEVTDNTSELSVKTRYYNTSAHGGGSWHCLKDLVFAKERLQLYSAVGTHATYTSPGFHFNGLYPDKADPQQPWETWQNMRPLVKEPYYGFSGSWGETSFVHWMNGPIPPGPRFKYLPGVPQEKAKAQWDEFIRSCPL